MENHNPAHKESRKEAADRLKRSVVKILKCTADQFIEFQYNEGRKYIKYFMPGDKPAAAMLENSRTFWNWWKNHWANRDETFLDLHQKYPINNREVLLQLYLQYHDGKTLAESIHPNSVVLDESCGEMIKELLTEDNATADGKA